MGLGAHSHSCVCSGSRLIVRHRSPPVVVCVGYVSADDVQGNQYTVINYRETLSQSGYGGYPPSIMIVGVEANTQVRSCPGPSPFPSPPPSPTTGVKSNIQQGAHVREIDACWVGVCVGDREDDLRVPAWPRWHLYVHHRARPDRHLFDQRRAAGFQWYRPTLPGRLRCRMNGEGCVCAWCLSIALVLRG